MSDASSPASQDEERKAETQPESSKENQARRWRIMAASVTGTSHARTGQLCQDSFSFSVDAVDDTLIAAVADGAGSAELSAIGSDIAARAATQTAIRLLRLHVSPFYEGVLREILLKAVYAARKELQSEAHRKERTLRDFATTLIVAICSLETTASAHIGDGAVVTANVATPESDATPAYTLFSAPQRGEYANTTNFITSNNWQDSLDVRIRRGGVSRLAMFTDGVQALALNTASKNMPHAPFFNPLFQWSEKQEDEQAAGNSLKAFLSSSRVTDRVDDDLTLLLAILT